jgi:hypothetical protein
VSRARYPMLALSALLACEQRPSADVDAGPRYAVVDAGPLRPCATAADCVERGKGQLCYFARPLPDSSTGFCGGAQAPCAVSYPFCSAAGRTVFACTFPTEPWARRGSCEDASSR